jgi:excinuclease ABC subunit C
MNAQLSEKLKKLPNSAGVYFHKDASGEIIYVGKAANLKNRVKQYFQKNQTDAKTRALVAEIVDTDWIETESEIDALFLESEMIKRYMPRYNILLRDDKSSLYVRIPFNDKVPIVTTTRIPADDSADYFGPFYNGAAIKKALRLLRRVFPFYAKKTDINSKLLLQLKLIPDANNLQNYKKDLRQLARYLRGERVKIQAEIEKEMKLSAKNLEFEKAADLRNKLRNLNELKRQIVFGRDEFLDISKDLALVGLRDLLDLPQIPRRIEAFDISHISGTNNVASMVVATNGVADKREYRKFKISQNQNDDYAAMREVITRRLKHLTDWGRPDLVILDGGLGQVNAVADLLDEAKIPFIGRNKSGDHGGNARVQVVIEKNGKHEFLDLDDNDHVAKLIARMDEEAHRFAINYHTTLRAKSQTKNALEEIVGIGTTTRKKLLKKFGSISGVEKATELEIAEVVGNDKARKIKSAMIG